MKSILFPSTVSILSICLVSPQVVVDGADVFLYFHKFLYFVYILIILQSRSL